MNCLENFVYLQYDAFRTFGINTNNYIMRVKNFAYRLICAVSALVLVACVDKSFNLDDVSKEVTVGGGTTVLPLGYLENKSIADLLGEQEIEGLVIDENGNLSYNYVGQRGEVSLDGVSAEFSIPRIESTFTAEYPQFDLSMNAIVISEEGDIAISGLEQFAHGDLNFYIPEGIALPVVRGEYNVEFGGDDLRIGVDVPEQIENINKIYFRDIESGHHGAPLHFSVAFNGLADINGGGNLKFDLMVNGGTFIILDAENNVVCDGNKYTQSYPVEVGADSVDFVVYIESLTNTSTLDEHHHLDIPMELIFDMEFEIDTKAGYVNLSDMPHISLNADFEFGDAEVAVDRDVNLIDSDVSGGEQISIGGLPQEAGVISRVSLKQNDDAKLRFFAHGLDWLGDVAEDIVIVVKMPEYLKLNVADGDGCTYDPATGELVTTVAQLDRGVAIAVEAFDFGAEGLRPDADGVVLLEFAPHVSAHFVDGLNVSVSSLMHDGDLELSVGVEEAVLGVESISGVVNYVYELNKQFALTGLGDLGIEIGGVGLKPVIEVNLTHPLTLDTVLSCDIVPSVDGVKNLDNALSFSDVAIPAATYENGEVVPVEVSVIVADESLRDQYVDPEDIFVAYDVAKLLSGKLPDTVDINISFGVDSSRAQTLYIPDEFAIAYDYSVLVPFEFNDGLDLRYEAVVNDLGSIFETIAGYDIKVGDVALIATVVNTTPLELSAGVTLLDEDGEPTEAQVRIAEDAKILGSSDGVTPAESVVRLELDFGKDGRVSNLGVVDGLQLELEATSAAGETSVALNKDQYIGVKLQLELAGGLTIDLKKLQ